MASCDRRAFLKTLTVLGASVPAVRGSAGKSTTGGYGVLVDIPNCIGCRKCEFACKEAAGLPTPPLESYDDKSVFEARRRPQPDAYTTVNRFPNPIDSQHPAFVKTNCLHCLEPGCVSACLVGALRREPDGAVTYDAWKCMGCRYCMIACPFQIPTYEYDNALAPQVRKCTFCFDRISEGGSVPACVRICPNDALVFGRRSELLVEARRRIATRPDVYIDHVYGEHEAGGTSWMYLSNTSFERLGFLDVGPVPAARLTEAIQHGVFKHWFPPLALYGLLGIVMWMSKRQPEEPTAGLMGTDGSLAPGIPPMEADGKLATTTRRVPVEAIPQTMYGAAS